MDLDWITHIKTMFAFLALQKSHLIVLSVSLGIVLLAAKQFPDFVIGLPPIVVGALFIGFVFSASALVLTVAIFAFERGFGKISASLLRFRRGKVVRRALYNCDEKILAQLFFCIAKRDRCFYEKPDDQHVIWMLDNFLIDSFRSNTSFIGQDTERFRITEITWREMIGAPEFKLRDPEIVIELFNLDKGVSDAFWKCLPMCHPIVQNRLSEKV